MDDRGRTLFGRRPKVPLPNASTTKMVTAMVVTATADLDDEVVVSARAAATGGGGLDLEAGDRVTVEDLLQAVLLSSSNDAAVALAEHVAGSEAGFVAMMNRFAAEIGAAGTRFVTAHGLDAAGHYSTAHDLARIGLALLRRPSLAAMVRLQEATILVDGRDVRLENRNLLLERYPGAVGIKTGFTAGAGNVLVAAAERRDRRVIAVVMRSADSFSDAAALLDHAFARISRTILVQRGAAVAALVLDPAGAVPVAPARTMRGLADPRSLRVRFAPARSLDLPLARGDRIGLITLVSGTRSVGTVPAVTQAPVPAREPSTAAQLLARLLAVAAALAPGRP